MKSFIACILAAVTFAARNENAVTKAYCQVTDEMDGSITGQLVFMGKERWDETKCLGFFTDLMPEKEYTMTLHTGGVCGALNVEDAIFEFDPFTTDVDGVATLAARDVEDVAYFIDKVITVTKTSTEGTEGMMEYDACCVISTESIED